MPKIELDAAIISIPKPLYLVIEDVGWWRGEDGSSLQQPFRNRFCRRHCLEDYMALVELSRRLSMRLAIGMVVGEWDRTDYLQKVSGATWLGVNWSNSGNRGPWLAEAAAYLIANTERLEIAVHGLCHEFWHNGVMSRSEFHDHHGVMRPVGIIHEHLQAFAEILRQNGIHDFPRIFIPPALHHSFGNGAESFQKILHEYGIEYVITQFSRARNYSPPVHEKITWEEKVLLLERGQSPVAWDDISAIPPEIISGPVVALHWSNLLHSDPPRNIEVVELWAKAVLRASHNLDTILATDVSHCMQQAAAYYLADMHLMDNSVEINLHHLPVVVSLGRSILLKIIDHKGRQWRCRGGTLEQHPAGEDGSCVLAVTAKPDCRKILIYTCKGS
jgi:hypothetical protein